MAIVGAGGIGFDVAEFLVVPDGESPTLDLKEWQQEWGVADPEGARGGVVQAVPAPPARQVTLLQRKRGKLGAGLGKTTGWIHRATLQAKGVTMLPGVNYERITPDGLVVTFGDRSGEETAHRGGHDRPVCGPGSLRELEPGLARRASRCT